MLCIPRSIFFICCVNYYSTACSFYPIISSQSHSTINFTVVTIKIHTYVCTYVHTYVRTYIHIICIHTCIVYLAERKYTHILWFIFFIYSIHQSGQPDPIINIKQMNTLEKYGAWKSVASPYFTAAPVIKKCETRTHRCSVGEK